MSEITQDISPLPTPPSTSDPTNFDTRGDTFLGVLPDLVTEINTWADEANALGVDLTNKNNQASASAATAQAAATAASAAANFLGEWSALTGSLATPAAVRHDGRIWNLLVSIADVTFSEPGVSADWAVLSQFYRITRTSNTAISINEFGQIIDITSGTFTQTFDESANLGNGFYCYVINSGSGVITLDPAGVETINISTLYQNDMVMILCDGSNLYAYLLNKDKTINEIILTTGNGYGSTNTNIRRFLTEQKNVGNAMTYADSAADGASITINQPGIYAISYYDADNTAGNIGTLELGVSVNSNQLTTQIDAITAANRLLYTSMITTGDSQANSSFGGSTTVSFSAGDVIRPHNGSVLPDSTSAAATRFSIVKVA